MGDWYNSTGWPQNSAEGQSVNERAEFLAIQAAMDKLPALVGHGDQLVVVRTSETGLTTIPIGKFLLGVSWTPVLTAATPGDLAVAYTTQIGVIHRIGQIILLQWDILTSTFTRTTAAGAARISGVPILSLNLSDFPGALTFSGLTKATYTQFVPKIGLSENIITFKACGTAVAEADVAITDFPSAGTVRLKGSLIYFGQS